MPADNGGMILNKINDNDNLHGGGNGGDSDGGGDGDEDHGHDHDDHDDDDHDDDHDGHNGCGMDKERRRVDGWWVVRWGWALLNDKEVEWIIEMVAWHHLDQFNQLDHLNTTFHQELDTILTILPTQLVDDQDLALFG